MNNLTKKLPPWFFEVATILTCFVVLLAVCISFSCKYYEPAKNKMLGWVSDVEEFYFGPPFSRYYDSEIKDAVVESSVVENSVDVSGHIDSFSGDIEIGSSQVAATMVLDAAATYMVYKFLTREDKPSVYVTGGNINTGDDDEQTVHE